MAQASPQLQQLVHHLTDAMHFVWQFKIFRQIVRSLEQIKGWLLGLIGLLLLLLWNWQLVISGSFGLAAMLFVYLLHQGQWQWLKGDWKTLQQVMWSPTNRSLTLAVASGIVASFSAYLTISIWIESQGSWLAKGLILQGMGILAVLLLLLWQRVEPAEGNQTPSSPEQRFDQLLNELADADPLKRLIAVRRLTHWSKETASIEPTAQLHAQSPPLMLPSSDLADCFRLMLNRETEPVVCRALMDSLHVLAPNRQLPEQKRGRLTRSKDEQLPSIEVETPVAGSSVADSSETDLPETDLPATHL